MSRSSHLRRVASAPAPGAPSSERGAGGLFIARIDQLLASGGLLVRELRAPLESPPIEARLALIAGYLPSVGDRLLVSCAGDQPLAIAVIEAARAPALTTSDGARG